MGHHTWHVSPPLSFILLIFFTSPQVMSRDINTVTTGFSADDKKFVPDTEYTARVRSSPNLAFYKGQWSDWSPEVHWRTEPAISGGLSKIYTAKFTVTKMHIHSTFYSMQIHSQLCFLSFPPLCCSAQIPKQAHSLSR